MLNVINHSLYNTLGTPMGLPFGIPQQTFIAPTNNIVPPPQVPGLHLKRALNYLADHGGCGYYRCISSNLLLNLHEKAVITESTAMILDRRFYESVSSVKLQRQATPIQLQFVKFLKSIVKQDNKKLKLIYEVDDVVFAEDIPLYNRNRDAFTDPEIRQSIFDIISEMDEVTVTTDYFRDYMIGKTGNKNVTTVPNYLMKWWFDRFYNLGDLVKKFEKNKKKPIVSIFASGTHVDVLNRTNQQDDFAPVLQHIIKARKDFQWQFYGSYPLPLKQYIESGEMKFFNWTKLPDYPSTIAGSGTQITFAALQDNTFNRCKSNIKLLESAALGIPCVCPDMVTYKDADLKYANGSEFIDCIKKVTKNQTTYADYCKKARSYADKFWLDDEKNLMKYYEVYFTEFGSKERLFLQH